MLKTTKPKAKSKKKTTVAVSGGFDPIHIGHIRLIQEAAKLGDELVVILNNDNWLMKKKKFVFMPEKQRKEVLEGLKGVNRVVTTSHKKNTMDMGISKEIELIKPNIMAQGGDRKKDADIPPAEIEAYKKVKCKVIYNVGWGGKVQSSSVMAARLIENALHNVCPCKSGKHYVDCGLKNTAEHKRYLKKLLTS